MTIRFATIEDLDQIVALESTCFSKEEAASNEALKHRLQVFPHHFVLYFKEDLLVSHVIGMVSHQDYLDDAMYANASLHDEQAEWLMLLSVATLPSYQHQGLSQQCMQYTIDQAIKEKRQGIVLTCHEEYISFYMQFGFIDEGVSDSTHGGVVWHQMRLVLGGSKDD